MIVGDCQPPLSSLYCICNMCGENVLPNLSVSLGGSLECKSTSLSSERGWMDSFDDEMARIAIFEESMGDNV